MIKYDLKAQVTSDSVIQTTDGCVEVLVRSSFIQKIRSDTALTYDQKLPSQLSLSPSHRYLKPPRSPSSLKYALPSRGSIKSPSLNYGGSADRVRVREFAPFCIPLVKNSRGCAVSTRHFRAKQQAYMESPFFQKSISSESTNLSTPSTMITSILRKHLLTPLSSPTRNFYSLSRP